MTDKTARSPLGATANAIADLRHFTAADLAGAPLSARPKGRPPASVLIYPRKLVANRADRGEPLLQGVWRYGGETLDVGPDGSPWSVASPSVAFAERLHAFDWIGDLCALGPEGLVRARKLLSGWIDEFGGWNGFSWRADIAAARLLALFYEGADLLEGGDRERVFDTLSRQGRHVGAAGAALRDADAALQASIADCLAALAFAEDRARLPQALEGLKDAADEALLADGGHVRRSPLRLFERLSDLTALDEALLRGGVASPDWLAPLTAKMAGLARFLTGPDGRLIAAHGGGRPDADRWRAVLQEHDPGGDFAYAVHSAYHRIVRGPLTLVVDAGGPPPRAQAMAAHASATAFWLYDGGFALIGPCGADADLPEPFREALRRTAAQCALTLDDASSGKFLRDGPRGGLVGPADVSARRFEHPDGSTHLEMQHAGWREEYALIARRRLELDAEGDVVSGEEALAAKIGATASDAAPVPYALRFHLHPDVRVDAPERSRTIVLGSPSGLDWRFTVDHGDLSVEPSVWIDADGAVQDTRQIVIAGQAASDADGSTPPNRIRWRLRRVT